MNKVLIIGGSGLIGQSLVQFFINNNFKVGALSRYCKSKNNQFINYAVDVLDYENLELVVSQYDFVINCIGQITNPINECVSVNTIGIKNIVEAVKKNGNYLIHLSTVAVYGSASTVTEETAVEPESVYGSLKYFSEYQISQNLTNYVILRISNLYGKFQVKGILAYILRSFHNNEKTLFFNNDGSLKRYYLHIDDLSSIIKLILYKRLQGVYNLIGSDFLTIKQLVTLSEKALDYSFDVQYEVKQPIENIDNIDNTKLVEQVDYISQHNIENYLKNFKQ
ncbi:NAD(P)-dependent oxidoreductase [Alphaproteobacteria bacterium]|nr:NAD(P)-dependent oxidoreductase [Alphaproteobacteria bacterium]